MKIYPITILLLALWQLAVAQGTFKKTYGTSGIDEARWVEVLPDGSFVIAGSTTGGGLGGVDAMVVKFSATGAVEWSQALGGSGTDLFRMIKYTSDGNLVAFGETSSSGAGGADFFTVKLDLSGNLLWQRTTGGGNIDQGSGFCEVSDGYILSGATTSLGAGAADWLIQKVDFNGVNVWCNAYGLGGGDYAGEPLAAANGDIWVSGGCFAGTQEAYLVKLNSGGGIQSATTVSGSGNEVVYNLKPGGSGMVASDATWSYSGGSQLQPWILSFTAAGSLAWAKTYPVAGGNYRISIENCPDGGFVFTPWNISGDTPEAILVKTNSSGGVEWSKSYTYGTTGHMRHVRPTPDGGYLAVGTAGGDFFILKIDGAGEVAGCCPTVLGVVAQTVTPSAPVNNFATVAAPVGTLSATTLLSAPLSEMDRCTGPPCCITDAGSVLPQVLAFCTNVPAAFIHNGDQILDNNDLLRFVLLTNPNDPSGSIIATSNTPNFSFVPPMQTGVTYYVAAVAGNNIGGNVNLADPCLDFSNAISLVWRPLPTVALFAGNPSFCAGSCTLVTASFTGTPPFALTYASVGGTATQTFSANTGSFTVCAPAATPLGSWVVQAVALTSANCTCQ
jgi:hypothetical protein